MVEIRYEVEELSQDHPARNFNFTHVRIKYCKVWGKWYEVDSKFIVL